MGLRLINCFLVFHKCGNNYVKNVHRIDLGTKFIDSVKPEDAETIRNFDKNNRVVNVRCRNFDSSAIEKSGLIDIESTRFLLFTRNPASFIWSATNYHKRGGEKWATTIPQQHLGGKTLTQALQEEKTVDAQHIVTMKHFSRLYDKKVSLLSYLDRSNFLRIRCEELFNNTDDAYFKDIAQFLRCTREGSSLFRFLRRSDDPAFIYALKKASPAFKKRLPKHSTGSFRIGNPYLKLGTEAKEYYDQNWLDYEVKLGYQNQEQ